MLLRRLIRITAGLLALAVVVSLGVQSCSPPDVKWHRGRALGGDLLSFWAGGAALRSDHPDRLYDRRFTVRFEREIIERKKGYLLAYPPPVYQAASRLVPLGYPAAARAAMVLMVLLTVVGTAALVRAGPGLPGPPWVPGALIVGSPAGLALVGTGHVGGAWMAALGVGLLLCDRGRPVLGGAALGLLCAKPSIAAPVLAALLLAGRGRASIGFVLGGAGLLLASLLADGVGLWVAWIEMHESTDGFARRMWNFPHRQLTLRSALAMGVERRSSTAVMLGHVGVGLGALLLGGIAIVARRARGGARDRGRDALLFGALLTACLLATPHLFDYDTILHAPAWLASAAWLASGRARRPRLGWTLLVGAWLAPAFSWVALHAQVPVGVALLTGWVVWMGAELSGAGRGHAYSSDGDS